MKADKDVSERIKQVIVVRCNLDVLATVAGRTQRAGLPFAVVRDRGLTQVPAGTVTCVVVGPGPADQVDAITAALRLL